MCRCTRSTRAHRRPCSGRRRTPGAPRTYARSARSCADRCQWSCTCRCSASGRVCSASPSHSLPRPRSRPTAPNPPRTPPRASPHRPLPRAATRDHARQAPAQTGPVCSPIHLTSTTRTLLVRYAGQLPRATLPPAPANVRKVGSARRSRRPRRASWRPDPLAKRAAALTYSVQLYMVSIWLSEACRRRRS
jgi:hypothetical protein